MKLLSIIGTRPQYIKIKPFADYCKTQKDIEHVVWDSGQHYSPNVSEEVVKDLDLHIDRDLEIGKNSENELDFMSKAVKGFSNCLFSEIINDFGPDAILVYGDTNTTFCASLVAYKFGIPLAHVEALMRCGDISIPEEVNRIFADQVASWKFCSSWQSMKDADLRSVFYCGDLEYEYLYNLDPVVGLDDYFVMTIHRQENMKKEKLQDTLDFVERLNSPVRFFVHHRTKENLQQCRVPINVILLEPCPYKTMIEQLSNCRGILTDSGGVQKVAPFFGKKAIVFRKKIEWIEAEKAGYTLRHSSPRDRDWLLDIEGIERNKRFYLPIVGSPSEIICKVLREKH